MTMTPHRKLPVGNASRGMAALTVVMVLFFVMALVAAYTNRNLIFEQRISANIYRSAKALNATDAGIDWTVAMLNGGRLDANCRPSVDTTLSDFRRRYLMDAPAAGGVAGGYSLRPNAGRPACVDNAGALACICPSAGNALPAMAVPADGSGISFRVGFVLPGLAIRPGAIEFWARGCATPGSGNATCYAQDNTAPVVDAISAALTTVGLVPALPMVPVATLTAGRDIDAAAGVLNVSNAASGITAHAGGNISPAANIHGSGPAGSTDDGVRAADNAVATLRMAANDGWFRALYGMDAASYQFQPAALRSTCPALAPCTLATLTPLVDGYPRNVLWFNGDVNLSAAANLGSAADPVFLIVTGTLTISDNVNIVGYVHARNVVWTAAAAAATLQGAMVVTDDFTAQGTATLSYDAAVLDLIRLRYGSFVRVPGSWNLINPRTLL